MNAEKVSPLSALNSGFPSAMGLLQLKQNVEPLVFICPHCGHSTSATLPLVSSVLRVPPFASIGTSETTGSVACPSFTTGCLGVLGGTGIAVDPGGTGGGVGLCLALGAGSVDDDAADGWVSTLSFRLAASFAAFCYL